MLREFDNRRTRALAGTSVAMTVSELNEQIQSLIPTVMMPVRRFFAAMATATLTLSSVAVAQAPVAGLVDFNGDKSSNGSVGGFAVGPYQADLTNFNVQMGVAGLAPLINATIWCVDFNHYANNNADSYYSTAFSGNSVGLPGNGDFTQTRRYAANGNNSALAQRDYRQAAWLIEQYDLTGGTSATYSAVNVQGTIWTLFGASGLTGYTDLTSGLPSNASLALTQNWYVLSDYGEYGSASNQEYLTSRPSTVPEPSTYLLMATGLAVLGAAGRRRRKTASIE